MTWNVLHFQKLDLNFTNLVSFIYYLSKWTEFKSLVACPIFLQKGCILAQYISGQWNSCVVLVVLPYKPVKNPFTKADNRCLLSLYRYTLHFGLVMRKWRVLVFITGPKGSQNLVFLLMHHWNNVSITLHFSSEYK